MKKKLTLVLVLISMLSGCKNNIPRESLWTAEQRETIKSIRMVEGSEGMLYEMNFVADYQLDSCIAHVNGDLAKMTSGIYEVVLPNSENPFTNISTQGGGCSSFSAVSSEGGFVLGRNYDYPVSAKRFMVVHTHPKGGYRSVSMFDMSSLLLDKSNEERPFESAINCEAALITPYGIFDGMNEKGLMCSYMQLENEETHQNTGKQKIISNWILRLILDKCASVDEALNLMGQYDVETIFAGNNQDLHYLIADRTGKRVVVEYVKNEMKVLSPKDVFGKDVPYIVSTNFYLTPGRRVQRLKGLLNGELGFWRFDKITEDLVKNSTPSRVEAMKYMEDARILQNDKDEEMTIVYEGKDPKDINSWSWMSLWSSVYNNELMTMDVCVREDYSKVFHFGLEY